MKITVVTLLAGSSGSHQQQSSKQVSHAIPEIGLTYKERHNKCKHCCRLCLWPRPVIAVQIESVSATVSGPVMVCLSKHVYAVNMHI